MQNADFYHCCIDFCVYWGKFFTTESGKLMVLATQWHVQVMPPCHYGSNSIGLWYDDQGKVYMGINFVKHGGQQNWRGIGKKLEGARLAQLACWVFCLYGTQRSFFSS